MTTKVFTRTACNRCGLVDEREGSEASVPPVGWMAYTMTWREEGAGWTNTKRRLNGQLCPACAVATAATTARREPDGE